MASDNQVSSILLLILIGLAIYFLLNPYEGFNNKSQTEFFDDLNSGITGADGQVNYENLTEEELNKLIAQAEIEDSSTTPPKLDNSMPPVLTNNISSVPVPILPPVTSIQSNIVNQSVEPEQVPVQTNVFNQMQSQQPPVFQMQPPVSQMQSQAPPVVQMQNLNPPIALDTNIPIVSQNLLSEIINESVVAPPPLQQPSLFEPKPVVKPVPVQLPSSVQSQMSSDANIKLNTNDIASIANFDPSDEDYDFNGTDLTTAFMPPLPPGTKPDAIDFKKNNVDKYNSKDFLPKQVNDEWFETDFSLAKYQLNDDKLINTEKYIIGINTVGESLKNASYDIRGTIPNPKFIVSPWNNSTYEPDFNLKPLC
jgi:hypothetical protein